MKQRTEKIVRFECDFCGSRFPSAWGCKSHEMTCEKNARTLIPCVRVVFSFDEQKDDDRPELLFDVMALNSYSVFFAQEINENSERKYKALEPGENWGDGAFKDFGKLITFNTDVWKKLCPVQPFDRGIPMRCFAYVRNMDDYESAAASFIGIVQRKLEYRIKVLRGVCELKKIPDFADIKQVFKNMNEKRKG